jgi:hypothetical protein
MWIGPEEDWRGAGGGLEEDCVYKGPSTTHFYFPESGHSSHPSATEPKFTITRHFLD